MTARPLDAARLPARAAVWLDLLVDGQVQRSIVVPVSLTWQRPAYLARRALAAGSTVQADDFEVREQNVAGLDAQPAGGVPAAGWRLRRAMQAGQVLQRALLPASGTVFPGDTVLVQARNGAIGIDIPAVVQAEAVPGQLVAVRTQHSSETLTGRLTAAGTVLVE
jgi:flagella basal body P-ring formation protein FlgA